MANDVFSYKNVEVKLGCSQCLRYWMLNEQYIIYTDPIIRLCHFHCVNVFSKHKLPTINYYSYTNVGLSVNTRLACQLYVLSFCMTVLVKLANPCIALPMHLVVYCKSRWNIYDFARCTQPVSPPEELRRYSLAAAYGYGSPRQRREQGACVSTALHDSIRHN